MINLKEKTVADYVSENIKTAHVFKKYGIDFCCGGGVSVKEACNKKNVDYEKLNEELDAIGKDVTRATDYNNWKLDFLIDHIVNIHHGYVLESIPIATQYAEKVARVHGQNYPELVEVNELFKIVAEELLDHMQKEERILFPYIKAMTTAEKTKGSLQAPPFETVENPIRMMEMEHESAGDIFKKIATLTNNYTPPMGACNTFRAMYAKLEEFEQDLHQHVHLENNILFPKAKKLESTLMN